MRPWLAVPLACFSLAAAGRGLCCARILCVLFLELLELLPVQWVGGVLLCGLVGNALAGSTQVHSGALQRVLEQSGSLIVSISAV